MHRLEQFFDDNGLFIRRQVLNGLVNRAAEAIDGVAARIREINKEQDVIQVDETTICVVLDESKRYYLWCTMTQKGVAFRISEKRNRTEAKETLGTQAKTVLSDGLNVYGGEVIKGTHANCLAHFRRMFFNYIMSFPLEAMKTLNIIVEIYKIEAQAKEDGLDEAALLELRQSRSKSLMTDLKKYIDSLSVPPRSSLGKAIKYAKKRWKELSAFLNDPRIEIDNNGVEREFKLAKLGLKNFLFCQSEIGCDALANFYTLIATCKLQSVDFETYLADILVKIEGGWPQSKIDELLPWNWVPPKTKTQSMLTAFFSYNFSPS